MIKIENLNFEYTLGESIIQNFSYTFEEGNVYLVKGDNGSGKTTLIKLIIGLLKPKSGTIELGDSSVISYLPDFNGIYYDLTVLDNVIFRLSLYKIKFSEKRNQFYELLEQFNLKGKEKELVKNLSLGMIKKVAVICTILVDSTIYILDEPTGGIDAESTEEILYLINKLSTKENIVICISHETLLKQELKAIPLNLSDGGVN